MTAAQDAEPDRDAALLARVAQGDMTAMRALYMDHAEAVQRFVRSRIRDEHEAADIVHDTMLAVWRGAAGYEGRASVRSWILSLARNKTVDRIRRSARAPVAEPDETVPDDAPDAATVIEAAQQAARLRACVDKLGERQRAAVHLAFFEELPYAEIARVEDVPEGTVKTRIHHAKKLLMRCLSRKSAPGGEKE